MTKSFYLLFYSERFKNENILQQKLTNWIFYNINLIGFKDAVKNRHYILCVVAWNSPYQRRNNVLEKIINKARWLRWTKEHSFNWSWRQLLTKNRGRGGGDKDLYFEMTTQHGKKNPDWIICQNNTRKRSDRISLR